MTRFSAGQYLFWNYMRSLFKVVPSIILFNSASTYVGVQNCRIRVIWRMVLIMVGSMVRMVELWPPHPSKYTAPLHNRCQIVCFSNMMSSGMLFFISLIWWYLQGTHLLCAYFFVGLSLSVLYFTTIAFVLKMIAMWSALFLFFVLQTGRPALLRSCV